MLSPEFSQALRSAMYDVDVWHEYDHSMRTQYLNQHARHIRSLLEIADSTSSNTLHNFPEWLKGLICSDDENYDRSLALFKEDANATTLSVLDGLMRLLEICLAKNWRSSITIKLAEEIRDDRLLDNMRVRYEHKDLGEPFRKIRQDPSWLLARNKVNRFCLLAGSARTSENPFESIETLRATALQHPGRETQLLAEIELLKGLVESKDGQLQQQRRIIEDLSYRHLLEQIPDPQKWTGNYAADWRTFWNNAVDNATAPPNGAPRKPNSPIVGLIGQFGPGGIGSIKGTGGAMYGALSTNIHHYGDATQGIYKIHCQRDKLPEEIMKALEPLPANVQNDKVDWVAERRRFV